MIKYVPRAQGFLVAMALVAASLSGCASVVYKDAASSYVAASNDLVTQLKEVSGRLLTVDDLRRRQKIVTDKDCPIAQNRIFVRADQPVTFTPFIQNMPSMASVDGCQPLLACEAAAAPASCAQACYSALEANCIKVLEDEYAKAERAHTAGATDASNRLASLLHKVEYGRKDSVASLLIADDLQVLAQYMDMLQKAAASSKVDLSSDVGRITDRINTVTGSYTVMTGRPLSSEDAATRDNITKSLTSLGNLGGHLQTLARNAKDAEHIKAFVKTNAGVADALIVSIENVINGDNRLQVVLENHAALTAREAVAARYREASTPYDRMILLDQALQYKYSDGSESTRKLTDVFAQLKKSHDTLTRLVLAPDDAQLKAIHSEEFQNFSTIVQDVADLIAKTGAL